MARLTTTTLRISRGILLSFAWHPSPESHHGGCFLGSLLALCELGFSQIPEAEILVEVIYLRGDPGRQGEGVGWGRGGEGYGNDQVTTGDHHAQSH